MSHLLVLVLVLALVFLLQLVLTTTPFRNAKKLTSVQYYHADLVVRICTNLHQYYWCRSVVHADLPVRLWPTLNTIPNPKPSFDLWPWVQCMSTACLPCRLASPISFYSTAWQSDRHHSTPSATASVDNTSKFVIIKKFLSTVSEK